MRRLIKKYIIMLQFNKISVIRPLHIEKKAFSFDKNESKLQFTSINRFPIRLEKAAAPVSIPVHEMANWYTRDTYRPTCALKLNQCVSDYSMIWLKSLELELHTAC